MPDTITPQLFCGFRPLRIQAVERAVSVHASKFDRTYLGPSISIQDVRAASRTARLSPIDRKSTGRAIILTMEKIRSDVQNALLRLIEEPPPGAMFVISVENISSLLPTVRSRCIITEFRTPDFGQSVKQLSGSGLQIQRAAEVATSLERGHTIESAPTEQDRQHVKTLLQAAAIGDVIMGTSVAESFTLSTLTALREHLSSNLLIASLNASYLGVAPPDAAIIVLRSLMSKPYANSAS